MKLTILHCTLKFKKYNSILTIKVYPFFQKKKRKVVNGDDRKESKKANVKREI